MKYLYYYISDFLSSNTIERINNTILTVKSDEKAVDIPASTTKTSTVKIYRYEVFWDILRDFRREVVHINNNYFGFKIFKPSKHVYLSINNYAKNQEYKWHNDASFENSSDIKLTALANISDSEYTGGDFSIFQNTEQIITEFNNPGTILVFPSYIPHKVAPVTSGTRKTITWFVEGPNWK